MNELNLQLSPYFLEDASDESQVLTGFYIMYVSPFDSTWEFDGTSRIAYDTNIASRSAIIQDTTEYVEDKILVTGLGFSNPNQYKAIVLIYSRINDGVQRPNQFSQGSKSYSVAGYVDIQEYSSNSRLLTPWNGDNYLFINLSPYLINCEFNTLLGVGDGTGSSSGGKTIYQHSHKSVGNESTNPSIDPYNVKSAINRVTEKSKLNSSTLTIDSSISALTGNGRRDLLICESYIGVLESGDLLFSGKSSQLLTPSEIPNGVMIRCAARGNLPGDGSMIDSAYDTHEFLSKNYYKL